MDRSTQIALMVGGMGVVLAAGIVALGVMSTREPHGVAVAETPVTHDTQILPPPAKPKVTIADMTTVPAAITQIVDVAGQQTVGEHSAATVIFTGWALDRLEWSAVNVATDETSYALAQKNIDSARGKRLCISGSVIEIHEDKTPQGSLTTGLIMSSAGNIFSFDGVGSSGQIVEQSWARFCGVVIDKYDYSNSAGGTGHAIDVVGMFDLPENRSRKAAAHAL